MTSHGAIRGVYTRVPPPPQQAPPRGRWPALRARGYLRMNLHTLLKGMELAVPTIHLRASRGTTDDMASEARAVADPKRVGRGPEKRHARHLDSSANFFSLIRGHQDPTFRLQTGAIRIACRSRAHYDMQKNGKGIVVCARGTGTVPLKVRVCSWPISKGVLMAHE